MLTYGSDGVIPKNRSGCGFKGVQCLGLTVCQDTLFSAFHEDLLGTSTDTQNIKKTPKNTWYYLPITA